MQKHTVVTGTVRRGRQDFTKRMSDHLQVFEAAFGCKPYAGTINVGVDPPITIEPDCSIPDPIDPRQVLLIEKCLINGYPAFRIRPSVIAHPTVGGWGDQIIEVSSCAKIPGIEPGVTVTLEFFRELTLRFGN